jgi:hypothetical protein
MINKDFLRYTLKYKNIKIEDIAKFCGCSPQNINHKIKKNKLSLKEIQVILDLTNLKYEEIFKKEEVI